MHKAGLCAVLLTLFFPLVGFAQPLPLHDALRAAVETYPAVRQRRAEALAAGHDKAAAEWARFPSLSAESSRSDFGRQQTVFRLVQPVWTGGRLSGQISQAGAVQQAAAAAVVEAEQSALLQTVIAYTDLQRSAAKLRHAQDNLAEHERLHAMILRRVATEVSPAADATVALSRLQQARAELIQFQSQSENARSALERMTGRQVDGVEAAVPARTDWADLSAALEAAQGFAPDLVRLRAQAQAAQGQIEVARSALLPQVNLTHTHYAGSLSVGQVQSQTYLGLQFQPGAGLSAAAVLESAAARRQAAQDAIEDARRQLERQVRSDWNDLQAFNSQLVTSRLLQSATRDVVESYLRQFVVGRKNWQEVLNAQREAAQAAFSLADLESSALLASLRLDIFTGRLTAQLFSADR